MLKIKHILKEVFMTDTASEKTLNLYPIDYPFETLVARINSVPSKLKLNPDFQRKFKWDKEGWSRSSKFIESCLMRIPLPSCYFAEDDDGRHLVIDGVQRLTTIALFFNDGFALENLTTFKELEGKKFSQLGSLQSDLEATTIRCIILRKDNPKKLIREIFSRLNQGAVELSDQEIRHAIFPGSLDQLLAELSVHPVIKRFGMADNNLKEKDSLEPEEQVLRYFAFSADKNLNSLSGSLKEFLDSYMESNATLAPALIEEHRNRFTNALSNCMRIFGNNVFTNPATTKLREGLVHYDLLMSSLEHLSDEVIKNKSTEIQAAYLELCKSDDFKRTLSSGLQSKSAIMVRKQKWGELLEAAINAS